ncbi:alpha- and gamma-adaptin-binding protein p34 isoform X1 [Arctopsyche grandis]|uniref:alpha- and gamma-adaptin-binding protein p34 isoform X1 n=1 Tax=Arctopsyche grandis TaxID=121162 RepID=UPI00406D9DD4
MLKSQLPCALFVSDFTDPDDLIYQILQGKILPNCTEIENNVYGHPWKIDTKYYNTTINLCPIKSDIAPSENLLNLTEALVLYFDSGCKNSFETLKTWTEDLKVDLPEILLLVCETFKNVTSDGVSQNTASEWCLNNGFELIELNDWEKEEIDDFDIIPDKKGIERVVEALHTHTWSNLELKSASNRTKTNNEINILSDELEDSSEFCDIFSQLHSIRESITSLPLRDRRACAEQIVSSFWNAIGGEDAELEDNPEL